jgi:Tol biopolymer transport system component
MRHELRALQWLIVAGLILCPAVASAQIQVLGIEQLQLGDSIEWSNPRFANDGSAVFLTSSFYNGIWRYDGTTRSLLRITGDQGAGYGFSLSPDGRSIAYRRTMVDPVTHRRMQDIVSRSLDDETSLVLDSGPDLSIPTFLGSGPVFLSNGTLVNSAPEKSAVGGTRILGIERTKIVLLRNGAKELLDPLGNGSYIWPSRSPDGTRILAFEMARGAFVCDLDGRVTSMLGRRNAPVWTRDGKWVVFMNDVDDGHDIISSDLYAIRPDGTDLTRLTDDDSVIELFPECSPVDNKIVFCTNDGRVFVLHYGEGS